MTTTEQTTFAEVPFAVNFSNLANLQFHAVRHDQQIEHIASAFALGRITAKEAKGLIAHELDTYFSEARRTFEIP
jgi:hypothetical protein